MTNFKIIILALQLCLLGSCTNKPAPEESNETTWRLGWRMIENQLNDDLELAELQFDSLINLSNDINSHFIITGLEIKSTLNRDIEIEKFLSTQSVDILRNICGKRFLSNLEPCHGLSAEVVKNKDLQIELLKMYINDQAARGNVMNDVISKYKIDDYEISTKEGFSVDESNRNRLKEIFKVFGFPNKELVGRTAMQGIFLMIQHSDSDKAWQESQLVNIENAVKAGDMNGQSYAYLYDRIKINAGKKQLFGTQFANVDLANKIVELADTEDLETLDARRRTYGMMPIEMYKRYMLRDF